MICNFFSHSKIKLWQQYVFLAFISYTDVSFLNDSLTLVVEDHGHLVPIFRLHCMGSPEGGTPD